MGSRPSLGKHTTPEAYEQAQWVAEGYLIGLAQDARVATYAELGQVIEAATGHHAVNRYLGFFLDDLGRRTVDKYGVLLPALVVSSQTREPGTGFVMLVRELAMARPAETDLDLGRRLRAEVFARFAG
jgi:hypothetical protein